MSVPVHDLATGEQLVLIAGDSLDCRVAVPAGYSDWSTGSARITGPATLDAATVTVSNGFITCSFEGDGVTPGTDDLTRGLYLLSIWLSDGAGHRVTIGQWSVSVQPNLSTGTPEVSHAMTMLTAIEAEIEARVTGTGSGLDAYTVDGVSVTKMSFASLQRARKLYAAEVAGEQTGGAIPRVHFTFTPPGST